LRVGKVIAKKAVCSFFGPPCISFIVHSCRKTDDTRFVHWPSQWRVCLVHLSLLYSACVLECLSILAKTFIIGAHRHDEYSCLCTVNDPLLGTHCQLYIG